MSDEDEYKCPKCGSLNLKVVSCRVYDGDMPLAWDGFIPTGSTEDEIVKCSNCEYEDDIGKFMPPMKMHGQTAEEWADELFETQCCDACGHDREMHDILQVEGNWFARCKVNRPMSKEQYLKHAGQRCPYCGSINIEACGSVDIDGGSGTQEVLCNDCGSDWKDLYNLIDYIPATDNSKGEIRHPEAFKDE